MMEVITKGGPTGETKKTIFKIMILLLYFRVQDSNGRYAEDEGKQHVA
jgi:hypothetical protein